MNQVEQLQRWGAAHGAARDAERQAALEGGDARKNLQQQARALREQADRMHAEIYGQIGRRSAESRPSA